MSEPSGEGPVVARCHCGAATITLPCTPDLVLECNCSLCAATGWRGVYCRPDEAVITGDYDSYIRSDLDEAMITLWRCKTCGIQTHWTPLAAAPADRMGVNARLLDSAVLDGVAVERADGRSW